MLIITKLKMPPLRRRLVERKKLIDLIEAERNRRLILVTGEAGSGKTTLVAQWIYAKNIPVIWYTLNRSDNEGNLFFRYVFTALSKLDDTFSTTLKPFVNSQKLSAGSEAVTTLIQLIQEYEQSIYLVLDDYHLVHNQDIHQSLNFLIKNAPENFHITLISRQTPPFEISKFRARAQLLEIDASQLRLTWDETALFFKEVMEIDLSQDDIKTFFTQTEGWLAGLQFIALALAKNQNRPVNINRKIQVTNRYVSDYLMEEVFQKETDMVQRFLLQTSVLEKFNAPLCSEITSVPEAGDLLEYLYKNNLFLISLDDQWYRYHPLLAELLQKRMAESRENQKITILKKAAAWHAEHCFYDEAFHYALSTQDFEFAADIMEAHLGAFLGEQDEYMAGLWLEKLPTDLVNERMILTLFQVLILVEKGAYEESVSHLDRLEFQKDKFLDQYEPDRAEYARSLFVLARLFATFRSDLIHPDINQIFNGLKNIPHKYGAIRAKIYELLCLVFIERGDIIQAEPFVEKACRHFTMEEANPWVYYIKALDAWLKCTKGALTQAGTIIKKGLAQIQKEESSNSFHENLYLLVRGNQLFMRNRLLDARKDVDTAMKYFENAGLTWELMMGYRLKAFILQAFGENAAALRNVDLMAVTARNNQIPHFMAWADSVRAELYLLQSKLKETEKWADQRSLEPGEPFSQKFSVDCLVMIQMWMAKKKYDRVVELVDLVRPRARRRQHLTSVLKMDIYYAVAIDRLGNRDHAIEILEQCVEFAGTEEHLRPFVNAGPLIKDLIEAMEDIHSTSRMAGFISRISQAIGMSGVSRPIKSPAHGVLTETLSIREKEVLTLLVSGKTNSEIADKACISLNTVKFHLKNIYAKLSVKNRKQAIQKIYEMENQY